jgi:hypothetical protein
VTPRPELEIHGERFLDEDEIGYDQFFGVVGGPEN